MSRAAFSVVMYGRMPSLFASHASANARWLSASSWRPAIRSARILGDVEEVGVHLGRVVALHGGRLADASRVESDDVVRVTQRLADGEVERVADQRDAAHARAAGVGQQRADRLAAVGATADDRQLDVAGGRVRPVQRRAHLRALERVAAAGPVDLLLVVRQQLGGDAARVGRERGRGRRRRRVGDQRVEASAEGEGCGGQPRDHGDEASSAARCGERSRGPSARDGHEHAFEGESRCGVLFEVAPRLGDAVDDRERPFGAPRAGERTQVGSRVRC